MCLINDIIFYLIIFLSYFRPGFMKFYVLICSHVLKFYVLIWYVIAPLLLDNSEQGRINICLFITVRYLQLTFVSTNLEGLKSLRFPGPLTLTRRDLPVILYISFVPNFSNLNLNCFKYTLWILTYIQTLFSNYATQNKKYKTKNFLEDV